ncbi:hypothetical protein [Kineosporia babensis]|uniref:Uncharacterized protein n=1 Tax=Kineosporia babensis TaxID=499548 RepID=A0A9X1NJX7_9ACTN|nr:hypothetical protein [Kineosporia babensis]MCD5316367.1 hypothetical protein [Kineosporia babensis]
MNTIRKWALRVLGFGLVGALAVWAWCAAGGELLPGLVGTAVLMGGAILCRDRSAGRGPSRRVARPGSPAAGSRRDQMYQPGNGVIHNVPVYSDGLSGGADGGGSSN